jgi:hypothetical protein
MSKDSMGNLVSLSENQLYPRMAKPSDFGPAPAKPVDNGEPVLWEMGENQFAPRHAQDGGPGKSGAGTPSSWGTSKGFSPSQNSSESGTKVSAPESVDFKTGQHSCAYTK